MGPDKTASISKKIIMSHPEWWYKRHCLKTMKQTIDDKQYIPV